MTGRTRRLLIACALLVALAVPVEAVLIAAIRTPDSTVAARDWAISLSASDLQDVALHIQDYPFLYRRAIMTALEPADRAQVWRRYLNGYVSSNPDLDASSLLLIDRAVSAMTAEVFDDDPPADRVAELASVFDLSLSTFGRRTATDLFMRLGPDDGSDAALPLALRATNAVREWVTLHARAADCDCSTRFVTSCDVAGSAGDACSDAASCDPDVSWPMCGVAWSAPCNGLCTAAAHRIQ
jgi:hypothetical protein